ncbi:UTRA domain-containing protein [Cryobacterium sp. SO2]|uniref:UTRA domain-containing protein n=1 Tax=Cryobacterium sp. SO2 TaxID=1897060 RepID=UPI00223C951D|nr:UTRA domain-containing protein [Cryobacterium sp. SO2]WEO77241.1 UTRA domain-containing protein [Cryobacterium sp. SO2]
MSFTYNEQRASVFQRHRTLNQTPLHTSTRRTYEQLRSVIRAGLATRTSNLEELTISQDFGASRNSVRLALAMLVQDGLISRAPRRGTILTNHLVQFSIPDIPPRDYSPTPDQAADGLEVVSLQDGVIPTPRVIRKLLGTDADFVLTFVQLGFAGDHPVFQRTGVVPLHVEPEAFFERLHSLIGVSTPERKLPSDRYMAARDEDFAREFVTLFDAPFGATHNRVEALDADDQTARLLQLEPGAPVLGRQQFTLDASGAVREYTFTHFRGDRTTLADVRPVRSTDARRMPDRWIGRLDHELIASVRPEESEPVAPVDHGRRQPAPRSVSTTAVVSVPVDDHPEARLPGIVLTLVEHAIVPASPLVRARMDIEDDSVAMIEQIGFLEDKPLFVRVTYRRSTDLPGVIRVEGRLAAADGAPTVAGFEDRYGRPPGRSLTAIEAVRPDKRTATAMRVPEGTPMLVRELLLEDVDGVVRELSFTHFRSDRVAIEDD